MHDKSDRLPQVLMSRLSMRHFQFVATVAEQGNILGAARKLNLTQPAVSRAIRDVESMLGTALFLREARGVTLTPEGELFVVHARAALSEMNRAWLDIEDLARGKTGRLVIGSLPNGASGPLPRALIRARQEHPAIQISVFEGLYHQMIPSLRAGDLDFVIGRLRQRSRDASLTTQHLYRQRWVVLARAGHPMAGRGTLRLADLHGGHWITPVQSAPIRAMIEGIFLREGLTPPENAIEMSALGICRAMLLESDSMMFLPRGTFRQDEDSGALVELDVALEPLAEDVGLFWRKGHHRSPVEALFVQILEEVARDTNG
ncbi:MAG: LysR family transcriptional regulator [Rhodobacteraceae bacterium]|nr:MAG: LysR family transcriptional regulator [Paracoccaceae bacterium]